MPFATAAMIGLGAITSGFNMWGASKAERERQKLMNQMLNAARADQARWDSVYGPVQQQLSQYVTGRESYANQLAREGQVRGTAESQLRLSAPAVAQNYKLAGAKATGNLAARGLGQSGMLAKTLGELEQSRLGTLGQMRQVATAQAEQDWTSKRLGFLQSGGQRPSLMQAYGAGAGMYPAQQGVDMSLLSQGLMMAALGKGGAAALLGLNAQ